MSGFHPQQFDSLLVPIAGTMERYFIFLDGSTWVVHDGRSVCLDVRGNSMDDNAPIQLFPYHGGVNRQWRLVY